MNRKIHAAAAALVLSAAVLCTGCRSNVDTGLISERLELASDLVTTKYYYTDWYEYEAKSKKLLFFNLPTDKVLCVFSGTVTGGIDISKIGISVDNAGKTVTLKLPEVKIISNELDDSETKYFDVKNSIFSSISREDYNAIRGDMKAKAEERLKQNGWEQTVLDNAEKVLRGFLEGFDSLKGYTIRFE